VFMSELRQDPTTYDWIVIAKDRAKRPHQFTGDQKAVAPNPEFRKQCPFCPGNEHMSPPAVMICGEDDNWRLRVVPNKFPALTPVGDVTRDERKIFRSCHGYGRHEVIVESPRHNDSIPFMHKGHVEELLHVYHARYHALKKDPNIKVIIIFKNHGENAGTSLDHPHSQIIASPIVPPFIRRKYEVATQYFDNTNRCIHHDIFAAELEMKERIVRQSRHFVVFHPFASHYPFETWIMPKKHGSSFGDSTEEEMADLADVLGDILKRLHIGLNNPDYNYVLHTAPVDDEHKRYYSWHIQIIPRLTLAAGFELGSGIHINIAVPEETADFMRQIPTHQHQPPGGREHSGAER